MDFFRACAGLSYLRSVFSGEILWWRWETFRFRYNGKLQTGELLLPSQGRYIIMKLEIWCLYRPMGSQSLFLSLNGQRFAKVQLALICKGTNIDYTQNIAWVPGPIVLILCVRHICSCGLKHAVALLLLLLPFMVQVHARSDPTKRSHVFTCLPLSQRRVHSF
jgi:hypothetical protein